MSTLELIAGLGNPGREYEATRHNFGFLGIDALLRAWGPLGAASLVSSRKDPFELYKGVAPGPHGPQRIFLLKPLTYMNKSGEAVRRVLDYYNLDAAGLLVLHDELDLPLGRMRLKKGGGNAGHNGLKSIDLHAGTPEYYRLRLGIGKPAGSDGASFVLGRFASAERPLVEEVLQAVCDGVETLARGDFAAAQQICNGFAAELPG